VTDIVERLRETPAKYEILDLFREAADEIERLRAIVKFAEEHRGETKALVAELREIVRSMGNDHD
jgi:hypothetical protein